MTLAASRSKAGYDGPAWTPALARTYIVETFEIEHSLTRMYRAMKQAGLSCLHQAARSYGFFRSLNLTGTPIHGLIDCIAVNVLRWFRQFTEKRQFILRLIEKSGRN